MAADEGGDGKAKRRFRFRIVTRGAIIRLCVAALIVVLCVFLAPDTWVGRIPRMAWHRYRLGAGMRAEGTCGPARMEQAGHVAVLHLYGSHEEMGRQYGTLLRRPISELVAFLRAAVPAKKRHQLLMLAGKREHTLPEGMRAEIHAAAEAAGVPYDYLVAMNVLPSVQCTALAAWGDATADGEMLMGRNAEYPSFGLADCGTLLVVLHPDEGLPVVGVSFIGLMGAYTGINSEGVAFGNMLAFNGRFAGVRFEGQAIQIAMRVAAHQSQSAEEMCRRLAEVPATTPVCVMVADRQEARVLEIDPGAYAERHGVDGVLAVSNYLLDPGLRKGDPVQCPRYAALMDAASRHRGRINVSVLEEALDAARWEGLNLQAVVFEPTTMKMHLSANRVPASAGPYATFDLRELFETPRAIAPE